MALRRYEEGVRDFYGEKDDAADEVWYPVKKAASLR